MHSQRTPLPLLAVITITALPLPAQAWDYDEHARLGRESYQAACRLVAERVTDARAAESPATLCRRLRTQIACGSNEFRLPLVARVYGQSVAIAADHLGDAESFLAREASAKATSFTSYVRLALENESHFVPSAPRNWRTWHEKAVRMAGAISCASSASEQQELFERAFYHQAFGDHFLQDAFSAGHAGFSRVASRPSAAGFFHDYYNREGRFFLNARGDVWFGFGDSNLDMPRNQRGAEALRSMATASVFYFLYAFITADPAQDPDPDLEIWEHFPMATCADTESGPCRPIPYNSLQRSAVPRRLVELDVAWQHFGVGDGVGPVLVGARKRWLLPASFYLGLGGTAGADRVAGGSARSLYGVSASLYHAVYGSFPSPFTFGAVVRTDGLVDSEGELQYRGGLGVRIEVDLKKHIVGLDVGYAGWGVQDDWAPKHSLALGVSLNFYTSTQGGGEQ
jgi:hypothetical protein